MSHDIEIILSRQLADCLSVPVFIVDTEGNLLFYNEPAEEILGKRFDQTGEMPVEVWSTLFEPFDDELKPLDPEELPLVQTLNTKVPAMGSFWIKGLDEKERKISVTSYPIIGRSKEFSGAVAIFWMNDQRK